MKKIIKGIILVLIVAFFSFCMVACDNKQTSKFNVTVENGSGSGEYEIGSKITVKANDVEERVFVSWVADGVIVSTDNEYTFVVIKDVTLVATYRSENEYTVTFKYGNQIVDIVKYYDESTTINEPKVPEKENYEGKWEEYTLNKTNVVVSAVYTPIVYTINFIAEDNKTTLTYNIEMEEFNLPEIPEKTGYTSKWEEYQLTSKEINVNAIYTPIQYTATFTASGKNVGTSKFTIEMSSIEMPLVPEKIGYTGTWDTYTIEAQNITINAIYTANEYEITIGESTNGSISLTTLKAKTDEVVNITSTPVDGYELDSLLVNDIEVKGSSFVMPGTDVTLKGIFLEARDGYSYNRISYLNAADITKLSDYVDEGAEQFSRNYTFNEFTVGGSETTKMYYQNLTREYVYGDYPFLGRFLTKGTAKHNSDTDSGRWLAVTPIANSKLYVYAQGASSNNWNVHLLSELVNIASVDVVASNFIIETKVALGEQTSELVFENLTAGNTYYLWAEGYVYYYGLKLVYTEEITSKVSAMNINTENAKTLYAKGDAFTSNGIEVTLVLDDNTEHKITDFTVSTVDTSTNGEKEVTVTWNNTVSTYKVNVVDTHTVTFKDGETILGTATFLEGEKEVLEPSIPTKTGYTRAFETYTLGNNDLVVNVVDTLITYKATFIAEGVVIDEVDFNVETVNLIEPTVPTKAGYTGIWDSYQIVAGDITINAIYIGAKYSVSFVQPLNGIISIKGDLVEVASGLTAEVVITPNNGWALDYVTIDGEKINGVTFVMPEKNIEVSAVLKETIDKYTPEDVVYIDAYDVVSAANLQLSSDTKTNFEKNFVYTNGDFEIATASGVLQYQNITQTKTVNGHDFRGILFTGGATSITDVASGRYIKITPSKDLTYTMNIYTTATSACTAKLLNVLEVPTVENTIYTVDFTKNDGFKEFSYVLEAGNTYYIYFSINTQIDGITMNYGKKAETVVNELVVDASKARALFNVGEEFNANKLVVKVECADGNTYTLNSNEYTVIAPDMTSIGTKDVVVMYGEFTTATYKITVE